MQGMNVDVVLLPALIPPNRLVQSTVVAFDVLRATTTITAALAAGVSEIRVYRDTKLARDAAGACGPAQALLCGEEQCLPPAGFDLGNSPGAFESSLHRGRSVCMSTTNGTRAILAAFPAHRVLCGAVVNAGTVARFLHESGVTDVLLLCAGTNGEVAAEDVIGAGAVMHALHPYTPVRPQSDVACVAEDLFAFHRSDLAGALRNTRGGRNVIAAGLEQDIEFAARLDSIDAVGQVHTGSGDGAPVIRIL
jgi:2-phosphosulfolactate phosphatase